MNAVIYARYSSDRQREESIEGQLRECTEYANKNNLTLIGSYVDRALSARTDDRPDFQRMIADSAKGLFEVVLVWKLDRFSRDRYDSAHYKHILKKNGVRLISAKENISDGPEGIILESMLEGYAEYYSAELSQKIRRGQQDNARKCMNNGGNIPLGYYVDKATGRLAVNPETAPYVQELFRRYGNGERLSCLQAEMKKQGLRSKRGNAYSVGVLSNLLKNRKYIGEYKYGKVIIPDGIPGIIDKELFERVQMRMAANKKAPARTKAEEEYLLTTKLFCGQCGRLMAGESGRGCKGIVYHYYKCSGAKRKLGCKKKAIRKNWIEDVVVKYTATQVLTDTVISRIADAIVIMQEQEDTVTPVLKQQLQQCETEIRNVMKAIRQGILTDSTRECLEELEQQRDSLRGSIAQLQLERRKFTKEEIVDWVGRYKDGNIHDPDYRREIIDTFVNSVFVYDDKLILTYNYKDGSQTLTLQEIEAALSSDLTGICPPKEKSSTTLRGGAAFLFWWTIRYRTRTHLNATVQWTVAEFRLDGIHTLMLSSPISSTVKAERFEFMKQEFCVCSKTYRNLRLWTLRGQCSCPGKNIEKKPAQGALPKSRPLENPPAASPEAGRNVSDCNRRPDRRRSGRVEVL